jgi:microcystin degradation protein MlrC
VRKRHGQMGMLFVLKEVEFMAYRVFVSSFQCESNTFCKTKAEYRDFDIVYDDDAAGKLAAAEFFRQNGVDVVGGVYASALPSGMVGLEAFNRISDEIIARLSGGGRVDGVYLYLHGAMVVEGVGSGEENLVSRIRRIVSHRVPIAVALDFHANNTETMMRQVNIIHGFRTAPHIDHAETERRAAAGLLRCLREKVLPEPAFIRVPVLAADAAVTSGKPLKDIMLAIKELDKKNEFYSAAFFNGQPWVDEPFMGPCAVIMAAPGRKKEAQEAAGQLAGMYWKGRSELKLGDEAMLPDAAISFAADQENSPVFISDSGDNTTAGAEGEGTLFLKMLMEQNVKRSLVCAVTAKEAARELLTKKTGEAVSVRIGEGRKEKNIVPVLIEGRIKSFGAVLGWAGEECGLGVVISNENMDVVLTDVRAAFISQKHIENMGVKLSDYHIIIVKLGYLFPGLREVAASHVFALTPGASTNLFQTLDYKKIRRPVYPLDKEFEWQGGTV